jgi:hypothetical protein
MILLYSLLLAQCKKPFSLPASETDQSVIAIEGNILTGTAVENTIRLSRLRSFSSPLNENPETKALVQILSSTGEKWTLPETAKGVYQSTLSLGNNASYQLKIQTSAGKLIESPISQALLTSAIDSVTWKYDTLAKRIDFFVSSHAPSNSTRYYRWNFRETWERHAWYESDYEYVNSKIVLRPYANYTYACFSNDSAHAILIGNNANLSQNIIAAQPLTSIYSPSEKLFVRYSLLVQQMNISKEAYDFWEVLKKNTELTGTLFDPQPSKIPTNLKCTNDNNQQLIGFVSVGNLTEQRIFVKNAALPGWPFRDETLNCTPVEKSSQASAEAYLLKYPDYLPAYYIMGSGGFGLAPKICVDCRLTGGSLQKPTYW